MVEHLGTPGAAGTGSDIDARDEQTLDSVESGPPLWWIPKLYWCLQGDPSNTTNTSGEKKKTSRKIELLSLFCDKVLIGKPTVLAKRL